MLARPGLRREPDASTPRFREGEEIVEGVVAWTLLGDGTVCESWMGWSRVHGRPVTVKICGLDGDATSARRGLTRERDALAQIHHPAFQRLLGGDLDAEHPFLVLEYVEGFTLHSILDNSRSMSVRDALNITSELLLALGYLHHLGLAHLDIKPGNMILRDGRVVLLDLGLVLPIGAPIPEGCVRGTEGYIAPEQERERRHGGQRRAMDIYSVGCVLYELLTGVEPAESRRFPAGAGWRHRRTVRRLHDVIVAMTNPQPELRPQTAAAALHLLSGHRRSSEQIWPPFVRSMLSDPSEGCPPWSRRAVEAIGGRRDDSSQPVSSSSWQDRCRTSEPEEAAAIMCRNG